MVLSGIMTCEIITPGVNCYQPTTLVVGDTHNESSANGFSRFPSVRHPPKPLKRLHVCAKREYPRLKSRVNNIAIQDL